MTRIKLTKEVVEKLDKNNKPFLILNGYYSIKTDEGFENKFCSLLVFKERKELDKLLELTKNSKIEISVELINKPYNGKDNFSAVITKDDVITILEIAEVVKEETYAESEGCFIDKTEDEVPY